MAGGGRREGWGSRTAELVGERLVHAQHGVARDVQPEVELDQQEDLLAVQRLGVCPAAARSAVSVGSGVGRPQRLGRAHSR